MTELLTNSGLKSLDPTKAHGCDNLSSIKMIQICKEITILLKLIFDRSLKKGKFPEIWKAANVVPVHKKENKCLNNELNCVLEKVSNWAYQWKMQFNPDPNKQMKVFSLENLTQTVFPMHMLNSVRIILLNAFIRNI